MIHPEDLDKKKNTYRGMNKKNTLKLYAWRENALEKIIPLKCPTMTP